MDYGEKVGLNVGVLMCLVNDNFVPYLTLRASSGRHGDKDKNSISFISNTSCARGCGSVLAKYTELVRISHTRSVTGTCKLPFSQAESAFPTKLNILTKTNKQKSKEKSENQCSLQAGGSQRERKKSKLVS